MVVETDMVWASSAVVALRVMHFHALTSQSSLTAGAMQLVLCMWLSGKQGEVVAQSS